MIRSRTVRLAATAVLGAAVLAGTTGCGGPMQAGAAVVADGNRTTDRDIQARVADLQKVDAQYGAEISKIQQAAAGNGGGPATTAPAPDQVKQIIDEALWARAAAMIGATTTPQDDKAQLENLAQSAAQALTATGQKVAGSTEDKVSILAQSFGMNLAPSGVAGYVHTSALQNAVIKTEAAKLNVDPSTISQPGPLVTAIQQLLAKAAAEASLKVSPRYASGVSLDPQTLTMSLAPATPAWVKAGAEQKAAAAPPVQPQS